MKTQSYIRSIFIVSLILSSINTSAIALNGTGITKGDTWEYNDNSTDNITRFEIINDTKGQLINTSTVDGYLTKYHFTLEGLPFGYSSNDNINYDENSRTERYSYYDNSSLTKSNHILQSQVFALFNDTTQNWIANTTLTRNDSINFVGYDTYKFPDGSEYNTIDFNYTLNRLSTSGEAHQYINDTYTYIQWTPHNDTHIEMNNNSTISYLQQDKIVYRYKFAPGLFHVVSIEQIAPLSIIQLNQNVIEKDMIAFSVSNAFDWQPPEDYQDEISDEQGPITQKPRAQTTAFLPFNFLSFSISLILVPILRRVWPVVTNSVHQY